MEATGAARNERRWILSHAVEWRDGEAYAFASGRAFEDGFLAKKKSVANRPKPKVIRKTGTAPKVRDRRGRGKGRLVAGPGSKPEVVMVGIGASAPSAVDTPACLRSLESPRLSETLGDELLQLLFGAQLKLRLARDENAATRHLEAEARIAEAEALLLQITRVTRELGVDPTPPISGAGEGTTITLHLPKSARIGD